ncbi:O-antigen ligase family protein [Pseudochrobactrum asaccharolyticum]|uniref:O-antigen ligase n=1 Tax=Pseudochrobactrum asaccharolyticum TaxID=354351 RepID=A0A366DQI1_9HYPH|nr:O-antigen ligase [Pseudochrobactrum asaccharolyticum]RBO92155.1 O-antigen ligase [Pseudochrobactrum asaccharolyticum]
MNRTGRSLLFILIFLLFWVTVRPFTDLRDPSVLLAEEQGNILQQLVSLSLFAASGLYLLKNWQIALKMLSPLLILLLGWQFVTVFTSDYSAIAFRRYIFSITAIVTAMAWVILPENTQHFQKMIKYLSLFVLLFSYFGVIFMPEISIHNMAEVLELVNAGSWRGHFAHKNIAGPAMIVLIIYNLYLLRKEDFLIPAINIILATIFLIYSNNKTSIGLVLIALLVAQLIRTVRILPLQLLAFFIPIVLMAALTVGTVLNPSLYDFVNSAISDPSFTGRTDIWKFAFEQLCAHPWIGFGFDTFWNMSNLVNGGYDIETWAARAGHAHNGYINLALSSGAIGVILFAIWMLFSPLLDYNRSQKNGNDPALATMYLRIWVFMMLYANLESPFFAPRGQVWFSLLAAVLALRLHARVKIR